MGSKAGRPGHGAQDDDARSIEAPMACRGPAAHGEVLRNALWLGAWEARWAERGVERVRWSQPMEVENQ